MSPSEDQGKSSPLPKACENCRIRKGEPLLKLHQFWDHLQAVLETSRAPASHDSLEPLVREASSQAAPLTWISERQIERIHERLAGIELALKNVSASQTTSPPTSHTSQVPSQHTSIATPNQFEGESSFRSQTFRASEVAGSLDTKDNGDLSIAIDSLKEVIHAKDVSLASVNNMHFIPVESRTDGPQMELVPVEFVIKLLARVKEKYPVCFLNYSFPNDGHLDRLCQRAYFPTEPMSLGEMTSMYGLLYYVLQEYILFSNPITSEFDCVRYLDICEKNFHAGIETYDLIAEASFDNAFALMLAASKASDEGKVILCWSLASASARHLQSLGYHRESTLKNDTAEIGERKRVLFWLIYGIEKNMSLNLGRASCFQDWDIDVNLFTLSSDPAIRPWQTGTMNFIDLSRLQGQTYEKLYSVAASRKSNAERSQAVEELSRTLAGIYQSLKAVDRTHADYKDYFKLFYEASDVIYYSLLTLIHRGASNPEDGSEISSSCFEAAKMCLKSHLTYFPMFTGQGEGVTTGYVNWILLYCSFTPFIVVFLHAVASKGFNDVKLLQDMTNSLEPFNTYSAVLNRLYAVCKVFSRVAEVIVRSQNEAQQVMAGGLGSYDQQTDSLFFPGFTGHHGFDHHQLPDIFIQGDPTDPNGPNMNDVSSYFGNWVSSNQPAMDLFGMDFGNNV